MMKALRWIIVVLISLLVGACAGYWFALKSAELKRFAFDMAQFAYYSTFIDIQMDKGTDAGREAAIRTHLALIEQRKGGSLDKTLGADVAAMDSALGYTRLALLARKRGAEDEAKQLQAKAESFCPQMKWQECSSAELELAVRTLDKKGFFAAQSTNAGQ